MGGLNCVVCSWSDCAGLSLYIINPPVHLLNVNPQVATMRRKYDDLVSYTVSLTAERDRLKQELEATKKDYNKAVVARVAVRGTDPNATSKGMRNRPNPHAGMMNDCDTTPLTHPHTTHRPNRRRRAGASGAGWGRRWQGRRGAPAASLSCSSSSSVSSPSSSARCVRASQSSLGPVYHRVHMFTYKCT